MFAEVMMLDMVLRTWKADPTRPRRAYRIILAWNDGSPENELPLSEEEVNRMKRELKRIAPSRYAALFPD